MHILVLRAREECHAGKVIVELKAKPGRRDESRSLCEQLAARDRPSGYQGSLYSGWARLRGARNDREVTVVATDL